MPRAMATRSFYIEQTTDLEFDEVMEDLITDIESQYEELGYGADEDEPPGTLITITIITDFPEATP